MGKQKQKRAKRGVALRSELLVNLRVFPDLPDEVKGYLHPAIDERTPTRWKDKEAFILTMGQRAAPDIFKKEPQEAHLLLASVQHHGDMRLRFRAVWPATRDTFFLKWKDGPDEFHDWMVLLGHELAPPTMYDQPADYWHRTEYDTLPVMTPLQMREFVGKFLGAIYHCTSLCDDDSFLQIHGDKRWLRDAHRIRKAGLL